MNELAALLLTALYYTFFLPVHTLFRGLALVLSPVYYGLQFVLLPFIYLAHIVWRILVLPFVLLAKLETLYVYLGVAGIIGVFAGGVLYFSFSLLKSTFNLDSYDDVYGVTAAEYRAARRKRKAEESYAEAPILVGHGRPKDLRFLKPRDVLVQTILEEDDSDY
ncbi:hypothetical protein MPH_06597 [Macrophomina phaseolina MS6]|uniref:Uncharacterized protein n=1 Tax=Macrophomina phaseolina (strain MS6) TaxID=1126212 RepID=K2SH40_MACPH|nr:hypothetical protein MPH_06597 [Macrophomina phaseolina MS6]